MAVVGLARIASAVDVTVTLLSEARKHFWYLDDPFAGVIWLHALDAVSRCFGYRPEYEVPHRVLLLCTLQSENVAYSPDTFE